MLAEPHHHVWAKSETWCIGEGMDIKRNVGSLVGRGGGGYRGAEENA